MAENPPPPIRPMKAISGSLPRDDGWAFEIKWDGMRIVSTIADDEVKLRSANLIDATVRFPELADLATTVPVDAILDGEVVAWNEAGLPDFGRLQSRMHLSHPTEVARVAAEIPITYVVFDVLWLDGHDTMRLPFDDRRRLLDQVVEPGGNWRLTESHHSGGAELLAEVGERGLEGIIAKRRESAYEPGRRSPNWRKVKLVRTQELVVGGWSVGKGGRADRFGSLLVGYYDGDELRFAGRVGTGFDRAELERLGAVLAPLRRDASPFTPTPERRYVADAVFVEPEVVVEVGFGQWTAEGQLRHPVYRGQRLDHDPRGVVREPET